MLDERPAYSMCVCAHLVTQSCQTLCDPVDCSLPGSSVHGDSPGKNTGVKKKKRILEWVAMPSSRGSSQPRSPKLQAESLPPKPSRKLKILEWVAYLFSRGTS